MTEKPDLNSLRDNIRSIDRKMIELMYERTKYAKQVGQYKLAKGLPVKNYEVEKEVIENSRQIAREIGLYEDMAESLAQLQIKYAVQLQEEYHVKSLKSKNQLQKSITIVGGLGKMGLWLADFFASFGHSVLIYDKNPAPESLQSKYDISDDLDLSIKDAEFIVLATPIIPTKSILAEIISKEPKGIIFDICSLKSPLIDIIREADHDKVKIASIHPMFGPATKLLSGQKIVFCSFGENIHTEEVKKLFEPTTATLIEIPIEKHDELMGYVLGLSHFISLIFAKSLSNSSFNSKQLNDIASSTFRAQLDVSSPVIQENQNLYYEIQSANKFTPKVIENLKEIIDDYLTAIQSEDRDKFKAIMEASRKYLID